MEKIVKYKAFDGTILFSEEECLNYEFETLKAIAADSYKFFDEDLKDINEEYDSSKLEMAFYVFIKNEDAAQYIKYLGDINSYYYPEGVGFWKWDGGTNSFRKITFEDIVEMQRKVELVKNSYASAED